MSLQFFLNLSQQWGQDHVKKMVNRFPQYSHNYRERGSKAGKQCLWIAAGIRMDTEGKANSYKATNKSEKIMYHFKD